MTRHSRFLLLIVFLTMPQLSQADLGPKPNFEMFFDTSFSTEDKAELLNCKDAACTEPTPFEEFGPQRFDCNSLHVKEKHSCFVMAYGFSPYLKLRVHTKDKDYESEPFSPGGDVDVTLKNDKLVLSKRPLSVLGCWWWCW